MTAPHTFFRSSVSDFKVLIVADKIATKQRLYIYNRPIISDKSMSCIRNESVVICFLSGNCHLFRMVCRIPEGVIRVSVESGESSFELETSAKSNEGEVVTVGQPAARLSL